MHLSHTRQELCETKSLAKINERNECIEKQDARKTTTPKTMATMGEKKNDWIKSGAQEKRVGIQRIYNIYYSSRLVYAERLKGYERQ